MSWFESIFQKVLWVVTRFESKIVKAFRVLSRFKSNFRKPFRVASYLNQFLKAIVSHELNRNKIFETELNRIEKNMSRTHVCRMTRLFGRFLFHGIYNSHLLAMRGRPGPPSRWKQETNRTTLKKFLMYVIGRSARWRLSPWWVPFEDSWEGNCFFNDAWAIPR